MHVGVLADDSTKELVSIPLPRQYIDRRNRGVTIEIREVVGGQRRIS